MEVPNEVGHFWFALVPILRVLWFPALVQQWTTLVELLQTNGLADGRRIKEAIELRVLVNMIDHLCQELQILTALLLLMVWIQVYDGTLPRSRRLSPTVCQELRLGKIFMRGLGCELRWGGLWLRQADCREIVCWASKLVLIILYTGEPCGNHRRGQFVSSFLTLSFRVATK